MKSEIRHFDGRVLFALDYREEGYQNHIATTLDKRGVDLSGAQLQGLRLSSLNGRARS